MVSSAKRVSPAALIALKEALANIYWYKKDLINFIKLSIKNSSILHTIDFDGNSKYHSASELIDRMATRPDIYHDDLLSLLYEVANFSNFSHFNKIDDADQKIDTAKERVESLRAHVEGHLDLIKAKERAEEKQKEYKERMSESLGFSQRLNDLGVKFGEIAVNPNPQKRGFQFEPFLNELFYLFDLDPKESFKIIGEQIDGAFTFDNIDYLLEARWRKEPADASDLYVFAGKISGKLKLTLGLFISINGFSPECLQVKGEGLKSMILMDGPDLNAVIEGRIDLNDLLYRKRRHASQTGEIYLPINKIL